METPRNLGDVLYMLFRTSIVILSFVSGSISRIMDIFDEMDLLYAFRSVEKAYRQAMLLSDTFRLSLLIIQTDKPCTTKQTYRLPR